MDALEISPEALTGLIASALIADPNEELSARYPEPGATHFELDPNEVAPGAGILPRRSLARPPGRVRRVALTPRAPADA